MTATLNGKDVLSCTLNEPRIGVWTAVVDVDSEEAISGKVTLTIDGISWVGTVVKGDVYAGRAHVQVVGGAGKLAKLLDAKYYRGVSLGSVVADLMRETGETLSSTTDQRVRGHIVSRWSRPKGKASVTLEQVADELGLVWRILRDGTVWIGSETWPEAKADHDEIDRTPGRDALSIAPNAPHILPGVTFGGKKISRVTTAVHANEGLRQELLFESASGGSRVAEDLNAVIDKRTGSKIDYSRVYPSRVVRQSGDGTLEIIPDSLTIRGNGLTGVPVRHGIPGIEVKIPPGGKVLLFFEGGDPKLPACGLWPDGSSVISATISCATELTLAAPNVVVQGNLNVVGEVVAHYNTVRTSLSLHQHVTAVGTSAPPTPGV